MIAAVDRDGSALIRGKQHDVRLQRVDPDALIVVATGRSLYSARQVLTPAIVPSYTRHPMQLIAIVMWLGVAMATLSWVIGLVCFLQPFLLRPFLLAQERMCLAEYGVDYIVERTLAIYRGLAETAR